MRQHRIVSLSLLLAIGLLTTHPATAADRTYAGVGGATLEVAGEAFPLNRAEGGTAVGVVTTVGASGGAGAAPDKRITNVKFEDIVVSLPAGSPPRFVSDALVGKPATLNGALIFAGLDQQIARRTDFQDAHLTAVTWPALDGSSKDAAYLGLALSPASTRQSSGGADAKTKFGGKQKQALAANFRVEVPGLPTNRVASVAPIEIRARATEGGDGTVRKPTAGVAGYDVSNVKLSISAVDATDWRKWHEDMVVKGESQEKTMRVILLEPNMKDELVSLDLGGVGIVSVREPMVGNSEKIARIEVELYAESAKITPLGGSATAAAPEQPKEAAPAEAPKTERVLDRPIRRAR